VHGRLNETKQLYECWVRYQSARQTFFGIGGESGGGVADCLKTVSIIVDTDDNDAPIFEP
jgi:hypothetical protein